VQNALEHAFPGAGGGQVVVRLERGPAALTVEVADDGVGVAEGFDPATDANLGLQIAHTLVTTELGGTLEVLPREGGGTLARVVAPLPR
jgi:two-component sensor histidine kinase